VFSLLGGFGCTPAAESASAIVVLLLDPEKLQSLCLTCYDKVKQSHERSRFLPMGSDGWPIGER